MIKELFSKKIIHDSAIAIQDQTNAYQRLEKDVIAR